MAVVPLVSGGATAYFSTMPSVLQVELAVAPLCGQRWHRHTGFTAIQPVSVAGATATPLQRWNRHLQRWHRRCGRRRTPGCRPFGTLPLCRSGGTAASAVVPPARERGGQRPFSEGVFIPVFLTYLKTDLRAPLLHTYCSFKTKLHRHRSLSLALQLLQDFES